MKKDVQKIYDFFTHHSRMPSYSEIANIYNYKSKNAAFSLVEKFIKDKLLEKDSKGKLLVPSFSYKLFLLGSIQAGFPGAGEEVLHDAISLDEWIITDTDASYILKVEGDSMINAGIHKGDFVVVERTKDFKIGMIVVAEIDGEWTLKYLRKDKNNKQYLEAANDDFPDMYPENELSLHAKVTGVVRKYE